jgi:peptidoglycan/LPS O-acetylase OafA/YrhL
MVVPERPNGGDVVFRDLIPGLTFIGPSFWEKVLGSPQGMLEVAFWSLFVEVKFYLIFGAAFFIFGVKRAIMGLIVLYGLYLMKVPFMTCLAAEHMGWFASGALFYLYFKTAKKSYWWLGLIVGFVCATDLASRSGLYIVTFFAMLLRSDRMKSLASLRPLLFLGFISYPLYLIHENMMVAMIIKLGRWIPQLPGFLVPIVPMAILAGIAWLVAKYLEPKLRDAIRYGVGFIAAKKRSNHSHL